MRSELLPRPDDRKVVLVEGTWDLLHYNHIEFLLEAKRFGNWLVVGVISDDWVASYKRTPVMNEQERLRTIAALPFVDEAFLYDGPFTAQLMESFLERYRPDVVVYSGGSFQHFYSPAARRGILVTPEYREGLSSTTIIDRIITRHMEGTLESAPVATNFGQRRAGGHFSHGRELATLAGESRLDVLPGLRKHLQHEA